MDIPVCACKGIRSCKLCESTKSDLTAEATPSVIFIYCDACRQAVRMDIYESNAACPHHETIGDSDAIFPLDGVYLVPDFLTEQEELELLNHIDDDVWIPSQSGRLKQDFGIKINFKKQTIKTKYFTGMPFYSKAILDRFKTHRVISDFQSVELCNLDYHSERGSHIDSHIDDIWIWGERLITLNLLSNTIVSLVPNEKDATKTIYIALPRRWLIVLYGDARYEYKHAIQRQHIQQRRLAMTFRELTSKTDKFYEENKDLYERILRIGRRFTGISVGRFEKIVNDVNAASNETMDVDQISIDENQLKEIFESNSNEKISSLESVNPTTYLAHAENTYLLKLFSYSSMTQEQLQSILSACHLNETTVNSSVNQFNLVIFNSNTFPSSKQLGQFLAQWRLQMREISTVTWRNPFDSEWFHQQYASIVNKKKNSYPFLLSNLFTCQQEISSIHENQLESGLLWTNNQQSFYLIDLVLNLLSNFDDMKEILGGYEEILPLTDDELHHLDTFTRLELIARLNSSDVDDDKQLDFLDQLSSNVSFVRNLVR